MNYIRLSKRCFVLLIFTLTYCSQYSFGQSISFGSADLVGTSLSAPTSLDFGPDNRLYVSQQNGKIYAYTIARDAAVAGSGTYTISATEEILDVSNDILNHYDDGSVNSTQGRLVTGLLTAGTPTNPILYVNSSDYISGGGETGISTNTDTNSGVLSKLYWDGTDWIKTDLVRGLPRSEEFHVMNGLDMFEKDGNSYLLIAHGGHTNKGAPSNNFAGLSEYFYSGAILIINLTQLDGMTVYTDTRTNSNYIYDLPTLNDPTRLDIDNTHIEFPYPPGHPMYNATIDINDPFGGNNGINQAFPEAGSPVQLFAVGFRNPYDILVTENNRVYTSDNGPNSTWGGLPVIYAHSDPNTPLGDETTITFDPLIHFIKNDLNENGSATHGDTFHFIGTTSDANRNYYGGHPIPILANPSKAEIKTYEKIDGEYVLDDTYQLSNLITGSSGYFNSSFTMADFPDDPRLGEYLLDEPISSPKNNILDILTQSTNGICEYTASNFNSEMQGDILTVSIDGNINRYVLNSAGNVVTTKESIFNGFGIAPLDIDSQSDSEVFPGTVWVCSNVTNNITVFEPTDLDCILPNNPAYDPLADYDSDGFTNQDEVDNGTFICSQGSKPNDNDGDFISDLNDPDDDNDTILDVNDEFAIDANNGLGTDLPIFYPFESSDPGTGFFGLGLTGLMLDPSGSTDYLDQYIESNLSFGGAAGKASVDDVSGGDALQALNNQDNAFQLGINVDSNSDPFIVHSKIESPYFGVGGSPGVPIDFQSSGIYIGNGDQDNYLKIVLMNGISNSDSEYGFQILLEDNGIVTLDNTYDITGVLNTGSIDFYYSVTPSLNSTQIYYSLDDGQTIIAIGTPITLPLNFLDSTDNKGLAVGLISTSRDGSASSNPFTATWDFINVYENQDQVLSASPNPLDFGITPNINAQLTRQLVIKNEGGPIDSPITITSLNFTGTDNSLFSSDITLPITIDPQESIEIPIYFLSLGSVGVKTATVEIVHDGVNSLTNVLTGELTDLYEPIVRINTGGPLVTAEDSGPDWESNDVNGEYFGTSYSVSSGGNFSVSNLDYALRDPSIPGSANYIGATTYDAVMKSQRGNSSVEYPMIFSIPVPNGEYLVHFYCANLYNGTSGANQRIFSVDMEGLRVIKDLDASDKYGHLVAGMIPIYVEVNDGILEIEFVKTVENPMVNAIEVLAIPYPEILISTIDDITSCELELADFTVGASGGNPSENLFYAISGQPSGIQIDPSNGIVFGSIDSSATTGGPGADGVHLVTVTVSKPGSADATENFTWTVNEDTEAPLITCNTTINQTTDSGLCTAIVTVSNPSATDNCTGSITYSGVRDDALLLTDPFPIGDTVITWTATDAAGNNSLTCDQTVTISDDELPIITCNATIIQAVDPGLCTAIVTVSNPSATDNCTGTITYSGVRDDALLLTDPYPVGNTTITWTATDVANNDSITCDQIVTITEDVLPVITCNAAINQSADPGLCSAIVTISNPTATDNCSGTITYVGVRDDALLLTDPFPVGDTIITWTATDISGNDSITCDQTVTITDNELPIITCNATINQTADSGLCTAIVAVSNPTATDNCLGNITYTGVRNDALLLTDPFPVGSTTITWTATDVANNDSITCDQIVTITDDELPIITCNATITQTADPGLCSAVVTVSNPTATDNCPGNITYIGVRSDALLLTDPFPVGNTTITWTATDVANNDSITCDQTVTITDDELPIITCNTTITQTADPGFCSALVTVSDPSATDNCAGSMTYSGVRSDALLLTDPFPVGNTTITWTATDDSNNDSITCDQTVTITDDESPAITCPSDIIEIVPFGITESNVSITNPTGSDNCPGLISYTGVRSDFLALTDPYPLGDTTITWTATDIALNNSITCEQIITVTHAFTLDLNVSLQGRTDYSGNYSVILYNINDLVNPAYIFNETASAAGSITISSQIIQGQYKVLVKHPMFLQRLLNLNLTGNQIEPVTELLAGDATNDNVANIFDFGILSGSFGLSSGDTGYDARVDFDNNNSINIFDFGLFSGNFGQSGDTQND